MYIDCKLGQGAIAHGWLRLGRIGFGYELMAINNWRLRPGFYRFSNCWGILWLAFGFDITVYTKAKGENKDAE